MLNKLKTDLASTPSALKDSYDRSRGPSSKYVAHKPSDGPQRTATELSEGSAVLQKQRAAHAVPPPPRRGAPVPSASGSVTASGSASGRPTLPTRTPTMETQEDTQVAPAPPYQHAVTHDRPRHTMTIASGATSFSQYTQDDKDEFFTMMDSSFSLSSPTAQTAPAIRTSTRPSFVTDTPRPSNALRPSYPPQQPHTSSALTLALYITDASVFPTPWYLPGSSPPFPPPLANRNDMKWSGSYSSHGTLNTHTGFALFGDLSACWWKIHWDSSAPTRVVRKEAVYRTIPAAWDGNRLYAASELYGPWVEAFGERVLAEGRPVGRGECWDVANSALLEVKQQRSTLPEPWTSVGRTHGHLLFYGKAGTGGGGEWKAGDGYVRPGDFVEWRSVKIREKDMPRGSWCTLGDPDHTALILSASTPLSIPDTAVLPAAYPISSLNTLTVVEQSQGKVPQRREYDLSTMEEGEIWIYRPVGVEELCGDGLLSEWPRDDSVLRVK